MVDIKNKKFGFSLAEALVSMLVMSMFFIATSKIITTKPKKEVQANKHGYFECYYDGGVLKQKRSDGSYAGEATIASGNVCTFTPPKGIAFALIYTLNNTNGRKFYHSQEPQFNSDNGNDTVTISGGELWSFQNQTEQVEEDGNPNIYELMNFFQSSYPSSSIYTLLKNNPDTYSGPAVFIGW